MKENLRELQVFAIRRSGQHAIIEWLAGHFPGEVLIQNNAAYLLDTDVRLLREGQTSIRDAYIFNIESEDLEGAPQKIDENVWKTKRGFSSRTDRILILRDPYNMVASRVKTWGYGPIWNMDAAKDAALWKRHAAEFLGRGQAFSVPPVRISYNEWFKSQSYRAAASAALGLAFTDHHIEKIAWTGSSFDGFDKAKDARTMDVLGRWKAYLDDPAYAPCFQDLELRDLADEIFGDLAREIRSEIEKRLPAQCIKP